MKILVRNKQRQSRIDLPKLNRMANKLAVLLCENLRVNKPNAKWTRYLETIEELAHLNLYIVSQDGIRKLNKKWLGKDKETDVLSFPLLDLENEDLKNEFVHLEENFELGEIFISYEQACKQAQDYGHSLDRELAFLFVHGLLHIFGFDHQNAKEEKEMFSRQQVVLNNAGYVR